MLIKTNVNAEVQFGKDYLTYNKKSNDLFITYRARIVSKDSNNF